ncbi:MAG: monomethylamine:corrinoid methyltransferase [Candidatus Bathyarchaeia archaeon]
MLDLLEVARRAWSGPRMEEKEWNMALFHKVQALVKRHDITAPDPNDRSKIVCRDNAMIDAAWQAGIDFLVEQGVYCYDTRRVIYFTEDEVKSTIRGIPETLVMGEGKDAVKASDKHMDGDDDPVLICGGFHSPYREDIAHLAPKVFMMIPGVDYMQGFTLKVIDGREIHGTAMAAYAARK